MLIRFPVFIAVLILLSCGSQVDSGLDSEENDKQSFDLTLWQSMPGEEVQLGNKRSTRSTLQFLESWQKDQSLISEAVSTSDLSFDLILGVLWEEWDYLDWQDQIQNKWAMEQIKRQDGDNHAPLIQLFSQLTGRDPWNMSFGSAQMLPSTLQGLVRQGDLDVAWLWNRVAVRHGDTRSWDSSCATEKSTYCLRVLLSLLLTREAAPFIVAAYIKPIFQRWRPVAGSRVTDAFLASLYYSVYRRPHAQPQAGLAGRCTIQRLHVLRGGTWDSQETGTSHEMCKKRQR